MAGELSVTPIESYWNSQKNSLQRIRSDLHPRQHRHSPGGSTRNSRGRHSRTPPSRLNRLDDTPPQSPALRGQHYSVIPNVKPRVAFHSPTPQHDDDDSWGEVTSGSDDDAPPSNRSGMPVYPMVMYPMMMPQQMQTRRSRDKHRGSKKRVRYRNTPTYLTSRENTRHEPHFDYVSHAPALVPYDPFNPRSNSVLARYQYPYGQPSSPEHQPRKPTTLMEPFVKFCNEPDFAEELVTRLVHNVLDDEIIPDLLIEFINSTQKEKITVDKQSDDLLHPDHPLYPESFFTCEDILDQEVGKMVHDLVSEVTGNMADRYLVAKREARDPFEDWLNNLMDDVIYEAATEIVHDVTHEIVDSHLEKAQMYDILLDMTTEIIQEDGPEMVREAIFENIVEDIIDEEVISLEVHEEALSVAVETVRHYSDKRRQKDIKHVRNTCEDRTTDSLCLDYLLTMIARQGELWTEVEHANRQLDDMLLTILLEQYFDVGSKQSATIDNKPLRRVQEKMVTDVVIDGLLEELCHSLDEDMADLDEYERGQGAPPTNPGLPPNLTQLAGIR